MRGRIFGKQRSGCVGMELLPIQDFLSWAEADPEFNRLWWEYVKLGYKVVDCPTPDRIDNAKGYVIGNIQWLTMRENSRKNNGARGKIGNRGPNHSGYIGVAFRKGPRRKKPWRAIFAGKDLGMFATAEEAARCHDRWARVGLGPHAKLNFPD